MSEVISEGEAVMRENSTSFPKKQKNAADHIRTKRCFEGCLKNSWHCWKAISYLYQKSLNLWTRLQSTLAKLRKL